VEMAVVHVDLAGKIECGWETLVNPQRSVGATQIHGIRDSDVVHAPTWNDLGPLVLEMLRERLFVAHNAAFDRRFLVHEFARLGVGLNEFPTLCTMQWSSKLLDSTSRKLSDCLEAAGLSNKFAHSAMGDAHATSLLLGHYTRLRERPPWEEELRAAAIYTMPRMIPNQSVEFVTRTQARPAQGRWVQKISSGLARGDNPRSDEYLALLDFVLLDGVMTLREQEELVEIAASIGINREQVVALNESYLRDIAAIAWEDGVVTPDELTRINQIATMLGLDGEQRHAIVNNARHQVPTRELSRIHLQPGDRVVFTGETKAPREIWEKRIADLGFTTGGVHKCTRLLVASDPDSSSAKAQKARQYRIPIITEEAFEALIADLPPISKSASSSQAPGMHRALLSSRFRAAPITEFLSRCQKARECK